MADGTWKDDACSLVDAFRRGDRSPREELEATYAAIESSNLNAFSFLDPERALDAADHADLSSPFGGVPVGIKELERVAGWPLTEASLVFRDRISARTSTAVERLLDGGGAVPVGLTTASEFGGLNVSVTKLNGVTHNPWRHGRTTGGSSAGSAAAVAGGLVPIATGGDGGGSIRIPAGYTGLFGMKGTFGRIPRGPDTYFRPGTVVLGCLARSVRDAARYFDVCAGYDTLDPWSLPRRTGWEAGLGANELRGRKVAIVPALGGGTLEPGIEEHLRASAATLIANTGMIQVDVEIPVPNLAAQWMMGNLATLLAELGSRWPACADDLTDEMAIGLLLSQSLYNLKTAAVAEHQRIQANEAMAAAFDQVDFVIAASNPGTAFAADSPMSNPSTSFIDSAKANRAARLGFRALLGGVRLAAGAFPKMPSALLDFASERFPDLVHMGALTIISNIYGNPAVSIPGGFVDGLPVGMQVLTRHHADELLFDVALAVERATPWPLIAASSGDAPRLAEAGHVEHAAGEVTIDLRGEERDRRADVGGSRPTGPVEVGPELQGGVLGPDRTRP
jgi:Asp-tRNA(Asn)/Glu-tRNA(Gln) amidotransferase A subunit family amidase